MSIAKRSQTLIFLAQLAYAWHTNVPFSVYGENLTVLITNLFLISLVWNFDTEGMAHSLTMNRSLRR